MPKFWRRLFRWRTVWVVASVMIFVLILWPLHLLVEDRYLSTIKQLYAAHGAAWLAVALVWWAAYPLQTAAIFGIVAFLGMSVFALLEERNAPKPLANPTETEEERYWREKRQREATESLNRQVQELITTYVAPAAQPQEEPDATAVIVPDLLISRAIGDPDDGRQRYRAISLRNDSDHDAFNVSIDDVSKGTATPASFAIQTRRIKAHTTSGAFLFSSDDKDKKPLELYDFVWQAHLNHVWKRVADDPRPEVPKEELDRMYAESFRIPLSIRYSDSRGKWWIADAAFLMGDESGDFRFEIEHRGIRPSEPRKSTSGPQ